MKTFRFIGMALLAVVMSVNLTSCSDDDEPSKNDDGIITNQKQLMQIKWWKMMKLLLGTLLMILKIG